jgi:hypothetical protein
MSDITERLEFDATRCELQFSKGVASNITEAIAEIRRLRAAAQSAPVTDAMCAAAIDADAPDRIQGFSYAKCHVIRDVWADKELWSAPVGSPEDYQAFQRQCQIERMRKTLEAALSLSSTKCTCGGDPDQPAAQHDLTCPATLTEHHRQGDQP